MLWPPMRSPLVSAMRDILNGYPPIGDAEPVFPAKDFYFQDFAGIANNTTLRSLAGWAAYNSTSSTSAVRDQWQVQNNAITRMNVSTDFAAAPGLFVIGRPAPSVDHVLKAKLVTLPNSGSALFMVVAATNQTNAIVFECVNSGGLMQNFILRKNVGGTLTLLLSQSGTTTPLGRRLQAGDEIELHVVGQAVHLFVNGYRITVEAGVSLDTGGAYTKGTICGFGSAQGVGSVFDDVYVAALAGTAVISATPIFWPGSIAAGGRTLPVAGTYAGDVQAIDYRVVNDANGAVIKDWARITGATVLGGSWSGQVFVPMGNIASNAKSRIQVRAANDTDVRALSSATAVGMAVGSYGQSNSAFRGQGSATSHAVANAYTWSQDASSVWQGGAATTTARSQLLATKIAEASGIPTGVFVFGVGSQTLAALTATGAGGYFDELEAACLSANAYGYVAAWLWTQGEAEAAAAGAYNEGSYRATFDTLLSQLRAGPSGGVVAPVGVCVIGRTTGGHISGATFGDANWSAVRDGLFGLDDKTGVFVAGNLVDTPMADSLHYTANGYVENGRRVGMSMAQALGYSVPNGRGPLITAATRSGAVITLVVDLNGAASVAGTGLTNYQVTLDGFATTLTINSAEVSGGNIVLTLSADPGAPVQVRSFYGMAYGTPTFAIGTYADTTTVPVEPLFTPIQSN